MLTILNVKHISIATILICFLPTTACAVKCDDYKHIEFALDPGMRMVETGAPALRGLTGVQPSPISYLVNREKYKIKLHVDETTYGPTIIMSIESAIPMTLKTITSPLSPEGKYCFSYGEQNGNLKFSWLDEKGCRAIRSINVAVNDMNGVQVAVESLSFKVVTNGRYCVKDAL